MTAYYNENDPNAAAWLRALIAENLIAPGDVDERSIVDVRGSDLAGYQQCHFFAGIGGWSLALRNARWHDDQPVWTGSCPCQPFSAAGRRKGFADERHLWPEFKRLIAERSPSIVFGEQVASASAWLGLVRSDLEALEYAVGAMPIEAASAGADHLRDRFWFVADAESERRNRSENSARASWRHVTQGSGRTGDMGFSDRQRGHEGQQAATIARYGDPVDAASCFDWVAGADGNPSNFVRLGEIARIEKGQTGIMKAKPGAYPGSQWRGHMPSNQIAPMALKISEVCSASRCGRTTVYEAISRSEVSDCLLDAI